MRTRTFIDRYERHLALSDNPVTWAWLATLAVALAILPFVLGNYAVTIVIGIGIACVGAIGLNLLTGVTGLISIGQSGFLATGAYTIAEGSIHAALARTPRGLDQPDADEPVTVEGLREGFLATVATVGNGD